MLTTKGNGFDHCFMTYYRKSGLVSLKLEVCFLVLFLNQAILFKCSYWHGFIKVSIYFQYMIREQK